MDNIIETYSGIVSRWMVRYPDFTVMEFIEALKEVELVRELPDGSWEFAEIGKTHVVPSIEWLRALEE